MRILSAFFTVLFTFINPVMLFKILSEMEYFFENQKHSPPQLQLEALELVYTYVVSNNLLTRVKTAAFILVTLMSFLHVIFSILSLYGIYACRPIFMRPLLLDIVLSLLILSGFVTFSITVYWFHGVDGTMKHHECIKAHLRTSYVSSAFLLAYLVWAIVSYAGFRDTERMHADFMYWIVEERMSLKSQKHNVSVDNSAQKSDRSSKGSKASSRSAKSERWSLSRPNSVSTSVCSNKRSSDPPVEVKKEESHGSNTNASNTNQGERTRRRSNKDQDGGSRNGSRHNSYSASKDKGRKDWHDRKSQSQGGNGALKQPAKQDSSDGKKRTRSTNSTNGRRQRDSTRTASQTSNGEYLDEFPDDLEEPFSDSDDEFASSQPQKMSLTLPSARIRTLSGTVPTVGYSPKWGGPTMCVSCLEFFDLPEQLEHFTEHLLIEHKIVVSEMELIVDPKRYIAHWRQRFAKESVDKIFPRVEPKEGDALFGKTDYFYNMSEALPEDYSLRQRLAMRRLEEALSCQQRERDDKSFQLQCIFCRYTARGNRSKIIHHLYMIHHLNLGSPDNLVFVTEYIEHLKEKMQRNECIYCEKTFQDKNTLMDHMRKRNHREVNPKNHYYDKFYIINYLELGKRWLDVLAEDFEDTMPTFQDSDEEEEDNSWCEWQEDYNAMEDTRVLCLMCDESAECVETMFTHMKDTHKLDLIGEIEKNKWGTYERMKLINYIRTQNFNGVCWICQKSDLGNTIQLAKHLKEEENPFKGFPDRSVWDKEDNLVPLFGNDHLLWMLESYFEGREGTPCDIDERNRRDLDKSIQTIIEESQKNTVEGVLAEDLPDLHELNSTDLDELM
ncbi:unnamed protein product [Auanema sp. JU1783]|nr:unnamed protein product [Auanema sp. JU1783]